MSLSIRLAYLLLFVLRSTIHICNARAYCHFQFGWLPIPVAQRSFGAQGGQGYIRQPRVTLGICIALARILWELGGAGG
jgi:hypothetical protein